MLLTILNRIANYSKGFAEPFYLNGVINTFENQSNGGEKPKTLHVMVIYRKLR